MKRIIDLSLSIVILVLLVAPMLLIAISVRLLSKGPTLYWSDRFGINNKMFKMPKFRSMLIDAPAVATHLLDNPDVYLSPIGGFLRHSSLDDFFKVREARRCESLAKLATMINFKFKFNK